MRTADKDISEALSAKCPGRIGVVKRRELQWLIFSNKNFVSKYADNDLKKFNACNSILKRNILSYYTIDLIYAEININAQNSFYEDEY